MGRWCVRGSGDGLDGERDDRGWRGTAHAGRGRDFYRVAGSSAPTIRSSASTNAACENGGVSST